MGTPEGLTGGRWQNRGQNVKLWGEQMGDAAPTAVQEGAERWAQHVGGHAGAQAAHGGLCSRSQSRLPHLISLGQTQRTTTNIHVH